MSIINEALQKASGIKETGTENIVKDAEKLVTKLPVKDKKILHYKWIYPAGIFILLAVAALALFSRKESAVKENPTLPEVVPSAQLSIVEHSRINAADGNLLPILRDNLPDVSEFKLTGIVLGEGAPMAIINESVYMKGDTIKDLKISEITKDTVSLEKDGRTLELRVK